ncbi:MAG: nuclear transport factor 2 family protein [Gemmatimonadota bacterium]
MDHSMSMSTALAGFLLLLLSTGSAWGQEAGLDVVPEEAEAEVRAALQHYLRGGATGDGNHYRKVFHPEARLFWILGGDLATRTSEEYIARARGTPAEDEGRRSRRITMVDVTGDAAVARIELNYPGALITDYMSLLRIDGEWRVVNKIFHVRRRGR